jgi:hypothetical protein
MHIWARKYNDDSADWEVEEVTFHLQLLYNSVWTAHVLSHKRWCEAQHKWLVTADCKGKGHDLSQGNISNSHTESEGTHEIPQSGQPVTWLKSELGTSETQSTATPNSLV